MPQECLSKPGGVQIECDTSASGLCWSLC